MKSCQTITVMNLIWPTSASGIRLGETSTELILRLSTSQVSLGHAVVCRGLKDSLHFLWPLIGEDRRVLVVGIYCHLKWSGYCAFLIGPFGDICKMVHHFQVMYPPNSFHHSPPAGSSKASMPHIARWWCSTSFYMAMSLGRRCCRCRARGRSRIRSSTRPQQWWTRDSDMQA